MSVIVKIKLKISQIILKLLLIIRYIFIIVIIRVINKLIYHIKPKKSIIYYFTIVISNIGITHSILE